MKDSLSLPLYYPFFIPDLSLAFLTPAFDVKEGVKFSITSKLSQLIFIVNRRCLYGKCQPLVIRRPRLASMETREQRHYCMVEKQSSQKKGVNDFSQYPVYVSTQEVQSYKTFTAFPLFLYLSFSLCLVLLGRQLDIMPPPPQKKKKKIVIFVHITFTVRSQYTIYSGYS